VFATLIAAERAEALKQEGLLAIDLRSIAMQGLVPPPELGLLAEAKALMNWHQRHRFCPNCGAPSRPSVSGFRRDCPSCNTQHFPRTDPVAIMLPVRGDRCLLGRSARFASRVYSALAGFIEHGETIEAAVRREIKEEAGVTCGRVTYLASQPWPFPMSLMIGCHAEALTDEIIIDREELEDARWFSRAECASILAGTHPEVACPAPFAIAHWLIRAFVEAG
jgi:NAD+ diphosphatase